MVLDRPQREEQPLGDLRVPQARATSSSTSSSREVRLLTFPRVEARGPRGSPWAPRSRSRRATIAAAGRAPSRCSCSMAPRTVRRRRRRRMPAPPRRGSRARPRPAPPPPIARELERIRLGRCPPEVLLDPRPPAPVGQLAGEPWRFRAQASSNAASVISGPPPYAPRARRPLRRNRDRRDPRQLARGIGEPSAQLQWRPYLRVSPARSQPPEHGERDDSRPAQPAARDHPSARRRRRRPTAPVELQLAAHRDQIRPPAVEVVLLAVVDPRFDRGLRERMRARRARRPPRDSSTRWPPRAPSRPPGRREGCARACSPAAGNRVGTRPNRSA